LQKKPVSGSGAICEAAAATMAEEPGKLGSGVGETNE